MDAGTEVPKQEYHTWKQARERPLECRGFAARPSQSLRTVVHEVLRDEGSNAVDE